MKKQAVYLLNITHDTSTNGVDRHISELLSGLAGTFLAGRVYHIRFILNSRKMLHQVVRLESYTQITIPLPEQFGTIIGEVYWTNKYNEVIYDIIAPYLQDEKNPIIHIHTLNLINLALEIKKQTNAQIITHLHCIPWKNFYNNHLSIFNRLYEQYYLKQNYRELYYTGQSEQLAYEQCDRMVACSKCGKDFVQNITDMPPENFAILPNGIADLCPAPVERGEQLNRPARLLFVGWVSEGKGVFFILEALRLVLRAGYAVELYMAGTGSPPCFDRIRRAYPDVPVRLLGSVPFEQLQEHYRHCDIGIIGSIQEQNSYVAIEMAMFGMPVVTTAIEGLDEMFTDRVDALKIPVTFDLLSGLKVNAQQMSDAVIELLSSPELRTKLSQGARRLYEQKYTLSRMTSSIVEIYESMNVYK